MMSPQKITLELGVGLVQGNLYCRPLYKLNNVFVASFHVLLSTRILNNSGNVIGMTDNALTNHSTVLAIRNCFAQFAHVRCGVCISISSIEGTYDLK